MGDKYIITISREFGSMGRPIAEKLAGFLGIKFYDRDLVEQTAKNLGLPVSLVSETEETRKTHFFNMGYPLGNQSSEQQDAIFHEQTEIIRDLADRGSCIIVGRCADYIFENEKNCLRVHIYASVEDRFRNCVDMLNMDPIPARKMIKQVDRARRAYHLHYAGYAPGDRDHLDLMINSSEFGISGTAQVLADVAKIRFGRRMDETA
ncbi:MAG: cytidylate kinase-like family protein [Lachnospiraceae bacterium]|jgi:cytidylate kinase|nr:cytidylate kinase-like family protein [Lachnospiraceae bacterium]MCI1328193.1 cytidylate kinase-like family protein [Lachnospiraceae bacterium]